MTPNCHNRPPYAKGRTVYGHDQQTGKPVSVYLSNAWFVDACKVWSGTDIGPNGERYPQAHGWADACKTCRWMPEEYKNA